MSLLPVLTVKRRRRRDLNKVHGLSSFSVARVKERLLHFVCLSRSLLCLRNLRCCLRRCMCNPRSLRCLSREF
jgi:hypothetical protein